MAFAVILFWLAAFVLAFTYIGYPIVLGLWARLSFRPILMDTAWQPRRVAVVMSLRNEASRVAERMEELIGLLAEQPCESELIIVSDGSTDATASIARQHSDHVSGRTKIRVIAFESNRGKAAALTAAVESTDAEIIIFADVRQRWTPKTIPSLVRNFGCPDVGAVSGELMLESSPSVLAGVGLYWRYEKWIRHTESKIHSQIGVTGAVSAVARECFRPIPDGTILDDVYWPMQVALQRRRVVFEPDAKAFDQLPATAKGEFRRKVRTLAGNLQLITRCPQLLVPIVNPLWGRFFSHKLLRLLCPWAWVAMLITAVSIGGWFYMSVFVGQMVFMVAGSLGLATDRGSRNRILSAIGSFMLLNAAAWVAFWCWAFDRTDRLWGTSTYSPAVQEG